MAKKVRSARGELVDFDLLKIKSTIASAPKPLTVTKREDFVDKKSRKRLKKVRDLVSRTSRENNGINVDPPAIKTEDGKKD